MYIRPEVRVVYRLFRNKSDDYLYFTSKILKLAFKTGFLVHNRHLNFCGYVENGHCVVEKQLLNVRI